MTTLAERLELAEEFARAGDPLTAASRARDAIAAALDEDERTEARIALERYERAAAIWRAEVEGREGALERRELADANGGRSGSTVIMSVGHLAR
jgi:hypothetical protein